MAKDDGSVLFVCIENSSRSQMAEGFARRLGMKASSAGTFPATRVNPLVVQAMEEKGVDISGYVTKEITPEMAERASLVVLTDGSLGQTMDKAIVKKMKGKRVEWNVPDPQGRSLDDIRRIRDDIERLVAKLHSDRQKAR